MKNILILVSVFGLSLGCSQKVVSDSVNLGNKSIEEEQKVISEMVTEVKLNKDYSDYTEEDWKKTLTSELYNILREKGTERAFTGKLLSNKNDSTNRNNRLFLISLS